MPARKVAPARNWATVRAAVVAGTSTRDAAERFGIPYSTLSRRAAKEGWCAARGQLEGEVRAATDAQIRESKVADALSAAQNADRIACELEEVIASLAGQLRRLSAGQRSELFVAQAVSAAAAALERTHRTRRLALGLDSKEKGGGDFGRAIDAVLAEMEASGELVGPAIQVDDDAKAFRALD